MTFKSLTKPLKGSYDLLAIRPGKRPSLEVTLIPTKGPQILPESESKAQNLEIIYFEAKLEKSTFRQLKQFTLESITYDPS